MQYLVVLRFGYLGPSREEPAGNRQMLWIECRFVHDNQQALRETGGDQHVCLRSLRNSPATPALKSWVFAEYAGHAMIVPVDGCR